MLFKIWKNSDLYPPLLKEIHDPPERLFWLGKAPNPRDKYFAIVGTRRPSIYGKQMAQEFSRAIAEKGFTIISGLAYGIDAIAHKSALEAGGKTIAVIASGLNNITPPCNRKLAEEIQHNGAVISEYENDFGPHKGTFPRRNRIIAGMSQGTLIIEAPEKSGALITARLALECNRDVFALPGNINQDTSKGTNSLIKNSKAFPATSVHDIFEYMGISSPNRSAEKQTQDENSLKLKQEEIKIYKLIKNSPQSIENLIEETGMSPSQINAIFSILELKGLISVNGSHAFVTR